MKPWTLGSLARCLGAPLSDILPACYQIVRADPAWDPLAILNPGCSIEETEQAETRAQHGFHPLHRLLLTQSNGGTIPCVSSISLLAAAVPRETEWRIITSLMSEEELMRQPVILYRMTSPLDPWVLGAAVEGEAIDDVTQAGFIAFAKDYGGNLWGYIATDPDAIDYVSEGNGQFRAAATFEAFLNDQPLLDRCSTRVFVSLLKAALDQKTS